MPGRCYWKRERAESPGHSVAIPNGTPFKIAIEGPQSNRFISGVCRDGRFVVMEGSSSETQFASANEVVNAVREPSSNAFLYTQFLIDDRWLLADDYRQSESTKLDEAEELALDNALRVIRQHPKGKNLDSPVALKQAAKLVAKRPTMIEDARRTLASIEYSTLEDLFR